MDLSPGCRGSLPAGTSARYEISFFFFFVEAVVTKFVQITFSRSEDLDFTNPNYFMSEEVSINPDQI